MNRVWNEDTADPENLVVLTAQDLRELREIIDPVPTINPKKPSRLKARRWLDKAEFILQTGGVRT